MDSPSNAASEASPPDPEGVKQDETPATEETSDEDVSDTLEAPKGKNNGNDDDDDDDEETEDEELEEADNDDNNENKNDNGSTAAAKKKDNSKKPTSNNSPKSKAASAATRGTSKSYIELVHEAIVTLKDRTGSSQPAIMKFLVSKYPNLQSNSPNNRFKAHVLTALKSGVKSGRFIKVRASWKINAEWKKKQAAAQKRKKAREIKKRKDSLTQKKKEQEAQKEKDPLQIKINALREKDPDSAELKKLLAEKRAREEAEKRKKYIAERLRKRRFPMEDTKLHAEDKELGVKPPKDVLPRPNLSFFFSLTQNDKPHKYAPSASRCEGLDKGNRGLVSDLLQVYHFFRGDVHYVGTSGDAASDREIVPDFSLKHLIYAVDDVLNGTAKKSRMVPPLIVHLFVTCLQKLVEPPEVDGSDPSENTPQRRQLQKDFATHLKPSLSPASWSDVCYLYMAAIDGHYKSAASIDKNVLPSEPVDTDYLLGRTDEEKPPVVEDPNVPEGYFSFYGDPNGVLARSIDKLQKSDPWLLTAEELMALLRALTDEVLARTAEISEDISEREEKLNELLKAKRAADYKFRKVRIAYEGPKKPTKKPTSSNDNTTEEDDKRKSMDSTTAENDGNEKEEEEKPEEWKPTATKKQFESAQKAQLKANDAYERGVRKLMARTQPIGWDRHFNGVYCFRQDPDVLYVEIAKPTATSDSAEGWQNKKFTWHVIENKTMFDNFVDSLDTRGKREKELKEEMLGEEGAPQSLRRFLFDDKKEKAAAQAEKKKKEELLRRMKNAELKCAEEEGRRSGRLAGRAEEEKETLQEQIKELEEKIKNGAVVKQLDYEELTGLDLLRKYDSTGKMETRRTREKKVTATVNKFQSMQCSKLCSTGNIDGTGLMGMLVSKLLELEETCESLAPWEQKNVSRQTWISDLENLVFAWNAASPVLVGPVESAPQSPSPGPSSDMVGTPASEASKDGNKRPSIGGTGSSKKMKMDTDSSQASSLTVSQALAKLRTPLLDLEKRVYQMTGLAVNDKNMADADDNMSTGGEEDAEDQETKEKRAWKKLINKLHSIPTKRHAIIREILVDAIAAARKAQQKVVVGALRAALLEFHPNAAGTCKAEALKVLESYGGYEEDEDDDDEDDEEEEKPEEDEAELEQTEPSALSLDAVIVNSSLDGNEDAGHADWQETVRSTKTMSRMASIITAFVKRAKAKLHKAQEEHESLMKAVAGWEKEAERRQKQVAKNGGEDNTKIRLTSSPDVSEVWANVEYTNEIVMARVENYPWWPAKKCVAKDADLEAKLKSVDRCLVSLFSEIGGIRVVETGPDTIREFTGQPVEEGDDVDTSGRKNDAKTRAQLEDSMAMARRVRRSLEGKKKSGKK